MADAMRPKAYRLAIALMVPLLLAAPFVVLRSSPVQAADFTSRRLDLTNSQAGVLADHTLSFEYVTPAAVGSITIEYCATSPLFVVACIPPAGLDLTTAAFSSESGEIGFSVDPGSTANSWLLTRAPSVVTPQLSSYLFTDVTNPAAVGSYFVRIASYASIDGTGPRIDQGGIAFAINTPLDVTTFVPPVLLFCVAVSIPTNSCASATGAEIDFGDFSPAATSRGTTQMLAGTNGVGGYNISVTGTTMTSGNNVIPGLATATPSIPGTSQFGTNLRDNSSPNIGNNVTGPGAGGAPTANFGVVNQFAFSNGAVVASSPISTDINKFTNSYIVNVSPDQSPGFYATTLTYIAFANF